MKVDGQGNIANVLQIQNKMPEALTMFNEVLAIFEKVHGRDHPLVADTKVHAQACGLLRHACRTGALPCKRHILEW